MTKAKDLIFHNTKLTFIILAGLCLLSLLSYILAVNLTVRNVVKREAMATELSHLSSKISEMEFKYINLKNSITLDRAVKLGFVPATETKYVSRKTSVAVADFPLEAR